LVKRDNLSAIILIPVFPLKFKIYGDFGIV